MVASSARARRFEDSELHRLFGLTLEAVEPGFARITMATNRLTGGQGAAAEAGGIGGSVHGGILAFLLDTAVVEAVFAMLEPADQPAGTADINLTYLRPALGERISAEARVLRKGRQLITVEIAIADEKARLCAKGRALYALRAGGA